MKYSLMVLLMLVGLSAQATDKNQPVANANANAGAAALAGAASLAHGGSATANGDVSFNAERPLPNSPGLSSGSSNTTAPHRLYQQRQGSFLLGGWTVIDMVLDLPSFIDSNPSADAQLGACVQDAGYRKFRELKGNPCPK